MERLRLAVKKEGALQFLSHLDFARCVRYVIIRARLPILYSEGFNPHMKLSFASALGVGVGADVEYLDMELAELVPVADVIERMNAVSPDGFSVQDGKYVDAKAPKLMAVANYAVYDIKGPVTRPISQDELDGILKSFNEKPDVAYEKVSVKKGHKVRLIAVKNHVIEPVSGIVEKDTVCLHAGILETEDGAIKPQQVWDVLRTQFGLPVQADLVLAWRRGIYVRRDGMNYSLFDGV